MIVWAWILRNPVPAALIIAVTGFGITAGVYRVQRDHARGQIVVLESRLTAVEAAGRAQAEAARLSEQAWANVAERLYRGQGQTLDRLAAITADNVSLAGRLRDADARTRALSAAARGATGNAGAAGESAGPRAAAAVDAALDAYDTACRRDAERLAYWQALWSTLSPPSAK